MCCLFRGFLCLRLASGFPPAEPPSGPMGAWALAWVIGCVVKSNVVRPPGTPARFPACSSPRNDLRQDDNANAERQHDTTTSQRGDSTLRHPPGECHPGRLIPPTSVDSAHCAVDSLGKCPSRQNGRQGRNSAPLPSGVADVAPPDQTGGVPSFLLRQPSDERNAMDPTARLDRRLGVPHVPAGIRRV